MVFFKPQKGHLEMVKAKSWMSGRLGEKIFLKLKKRRGGVSTNAL